MSPILMHDLNGALYMCNISIGTPRQHFIVVPDTGSPTLWVISDQCTDESCRKKHRFNPSKSSSFAPKPGTLHVEYGDGSSAKGRYGSDTLTISDDMRNLQLQRTAFGMADDIVRMSNLPVDGILGLSLPIDRVSPYKPPFIDHMDVLEKPVFTVWMLRNTRIEEVEEHDFGGTITYGGLDEKHCSSFIAYQSLTYPASGFWIFRMDFVSVDGVRIGNAGWDKVISDTGTSFIFGPMYVMEKIQWALGGSYYLGGTFVTKCDKRHPTLVFGIGGAEYMIEPSNYLLKVDVENNICVFLMGGLESAGHGVQWIFGDPFIREYCQVHDMERKRIGFSCPKSKPNCNLASGDSVPPTSTTSYVLLLLGSIIVGYVPQK